MKAKKVLITLLALGTSLSFTACNGGTTEKETAKTESAKTESSKTETTNTETTEADKTETVKADTENTETENTGSDTAQITYEETDTDPSDNTSDSELDNLYQQENQLFADHKDAWDKAFGLMSSIKPLQMILKPYEKLKNRLQNLKRKIQKQTLQKQKLRQMIPLLLITFPEKISMEIQLMKVCFPRMQ